MPEYTKDTLPDWCQPGKPVVAINTSGWHSRIDFEGKIEKIGVRDITVSLKRSPSIIRRFRVRDLNEQSKGYRSSKLVSPKDPVLNDLRKAERHRQRVNEARARVSDWERDRDHPLPAIEALVEILPSGSLKKALKKALSDHQPTGKGSES